MAKRRKVQGAPRRRAVRKPPRPAHGRCELCKRTRPLTFHHLIPRDTHDKRWARQRFDSAEMRSRGVWVCRPCHSFIHDHFDEATLAQRLNTVEALKAEPLMVRHLHWAQRQR